MGGKRREHVLQDNKEIIKELYDEGSFSFLKNY